MSVQTREVPQELDAFAMEDQAQHPRDPGAWIGTRAILLGAPHWAELALEGDVLTQRGAEDQRVKTRWPVVGVPRIAGSPDQRLESLPFRIVLDTRDEASNLSSRESKGLLR